TGGQNAGFYIDIAVSQGYPDATVTEHRAPRMGRSRFGQAHFGTWNAQFMWTLNTGGRQRLGRRGQSRHRDRVFDSSSSTGAQRRIR
ncbi:tail protein, partial [Pseudomonas syringae pv. actinidiae ICMP 19070]